MAKYKDGNFLQVSREVFKNAEFMKLSDSAKWLMFVLMENEHKFTGLNEDFFFRSNDDLAKDCGWQRSKLCRIKDEVVKSGLIKTWQMHWLHDDGKKSEKHVTAYRLKI